MRVVLDTNQHVSALITPDGNPASIVQLWRAWVIELATSPLLLAEFEEVIRRPHIQERHNLSDTDIADYLETLRRYALVVPGEVVVNVVEDDPDDDAVIACALEAEADAIVSGDRHLLSLGSYRGIQIVRAADFLRGYAVN